MRFVAHHYERVYPRSDPSQRFWAKVAKGSPDECWEWTGARLPTGYGVFNEGRKAVNAHRFSFALANGEIPRGTHVLHGCDNPPCVNPAHLHLGTHVQNMLEMRLRGRSSGGRGERHRSAKLTERQVRHMRRTYKNQRGEMPALARRYGVTTAAIYCVITRRTWRHI